MNNDLVNVPPFPYKGEPWTSCFSVPMKKQTMCLLVSFCGEEEIRGLQRSHIILQSSGTAGHAGSRGLSQ